MKYIASLSLLVLSLCIVTATGQDKGKPGATVTLKGSVTVKKSGTLPKFSSPITHVPHHVPPAKAGGMWHWHQHHGWVWLQTGAATTVLLPETFVLPAQVTYFETASVPVQVVCPHCGKPFVFYAK